MSNKYIDLSLPLSNDTPVYPGDPKVKIKPVLTIPKDGCSVHQYEFGGHTGTHIDAPAHFVEGGKTLDQLSVEAFVMRGSVIPVHGEKLIKKDALRNRKVF